MRNDFIEHSAKGTSWTKKDHKYSSKKRGKSGNMVYTYSATSIADNAVGIKNKDFLEDFSASLGGFEFIRKIREKMNSIVIWSPNKNQDTLVRRGQSAIAKIFNSGSNKKATKR